MLCIVYTNISYNVYNLRMVYNTIKALLLVKKFGFNTRGITMHC